LFNPDSLQSSQSFADQVVGVYPTGYLDADTSVDDYYVEALIPVLQGKPAFDRLELEIGARYSDYEHTDADNTWKTMINWQVNDILRFRGGYNRAVRAPNLGELFLNVQEIFSATAGNPYGDACGVRSNSPYGAGGTGPDPVVGSGETSPFSPIAPGQTPEGAASSRLICEAMMGGAGSGGVNQFYNINNAPPVSGAGGFAWVLQKGNPNLKSEVADTWTWGLVASLGNNMTWSFDWYRIEIEDAIMQYSLAYATYRCFGTRMVTNATEAAEQARTQGCQDVPRDLNNGGALNALVSYDNQATIKTSGMDIGWNWFKPIGSGSLAFSLQATILDYYKTKQSPAAFDPVIDWAGSLGPSLSGTNGGAYDYRLFGSVNYARNDWNVGLRWRHLPSTFSVAYATQQAQRQNNAAVAAGAPGMMLSWIPTTEYESADYNVFDLSFGWNINDTISFRGGITNLFDTEPEMVGGTTGYPAGTDLANVCESLGFPNAAGTAPAISQGCTDPTTYSLPGYVSYNAGYYDTLGRRFFLGFSVNF